jgi:two-component system phosphate regulon sensor histidine kinase PhoR
LKFDSFSTRTFLALTGLVAVLLAGAAIFGDFQIRRHQEEALHTQLLGIAQMLSADSAAVLAQRAPREPFAQRLIDLGTANQIRLTLIAEDGTVVADSEALGPLPNHGDRPEIVAARQSGSGFSERNSATTGKDTF